jgi:hypothetical protein
MRIQNKIITNRRRRVVKAPRPETTDVRDERFNRVQKFCVPPRIRRPVAFVVRRMAVFVISGREE